MLSDPWKSSVRYLARFPVSTDLARKQIWDQSPRLQIRGPISRSAAIHRYSALPSRWLVIGTRSAWQWYEAHYKRGSCQLEKTNISLLNRVEANLSRIRQRFTKRLPPKVWQVTRSAPLRAVPTKNWSWRGRDQSWSSSCRMGASTVERWNRFSGKWRRC